MAEQNSIVEITEEAEEMLEVLFADARASAIDKNPHNHRGRTLDEIDEDITALRKTFGIEL